MEIEVKKTPQVVEVFIEGNIKSLSDNDNLKNVITDIYNEDDQVQISIFIQDSFIITSSVIGFLIKCIKKDRMQITIYVSNQELFEMLDDMNLISTLNIRKRG